jgi:hypothetical protein
MSLPLSSDPRVPDPLAPADPLGPRPPGYRPLRYLIPWVPDPWVPDPWVPDPLGYPTPCGWTVGTADFRSADSRSQAFAVRVRGLRMVTRSGLWADRWRSPSNHVGYSRHTGE